MNTPITFYKAPLSAMEVGSPPPSPYIGLKSGETMWVFKNGVPDMNSEYSSLHVVKVGTRKIGFSRGFYDSSSNTLFHNMCWGSDKCWVKRNGIFVSVNSPLLRNR